MTFSSSEEQPHQDMIALKELCFSHGAMAFKNKGLNYFSAEDVHSGQARQVKTQENKYFDDLIIKSGEVVLTKNKKPLTKSILMPREKYRRNWAMVPFRERLEWRKEIAMDCGYHIINDIKCQHRSNSLPFPSV